MCKRHVNARAGMSKSLRLYLILICIVEYMMPLLRFGTAIKCVYIHTQMEASVYDSVSVLFSAVAYSALVKI